MTIIVIKNVDIDDLDLSVRAWNCLRRAKIDNVQDIVDNYDNLTKVRNLGQRCYNEVLDKIKPYVEFVDKIQITNYDRIKSMSIDELAEFLEDEDNLATQYCNKNCCIHFEDNGDCKAYKAVKRNSCVQAVKQWLESEVSEQWLN